MAQYHIPDPEELVPCPYDKVHMVRAKRMQYHLMKCRKNYVGREFAVCPFNARHEMPKPELRYHIINCPDKAMIEPNLSYERAKKEGEGTMFKGYTDVPVYEDLVIKSDENWDDEIPAVPRIGVDPAYFARIDQRVLTTGLSKAKKRDLHKQFFLPPEERRYVGDSAPVKENEESEEEREGGQLRLPKSAPQSYVPSKPKTTQQPSQAFAYSLAMAGVGRGMGVKMNSEAQNSMGMNGVSQPPAMMGRGRGIGRGAPPGFNMPPPDAMMNGAPPVAHGNHMAPGSYQGTAPNTNNSSIFTMGIGRGRGVPNQAAGDKPQFVVPNNNVIITCNRQNGDNNSDAEPVNIEREQKKLQKKLRQIEMLEEKQKEGYKLSEEEEMKVSKRTDLEEALQALQI